MRQLSKLIIFFSLAIISCSHKLQSITLEYITYTPSEDDKRFQAFWLTVIDSLKNSKVHYLKTISLDSLWACDSYCSSEVFFQKCYPNIFNKKRLALLSDTAKITYTWTEADRNSLPTDAKSKIIRKGKFYAFKQVQISKLKKEVVHIFMSIDFIETNDGYKFYGADYHTKRQCCR